MAPIFPASRHIDPGSCFVGQLVPLHEIIPPVVKWWLARVALKKPTIWTTMKGMKGMDFFRSTHTVFVCQDQKKLHRLLWYCISLWRSMLLCLHSYHTKVATGYQIVAIGYTYILFVMFKPAQVCCGKWLRRAHKPNTLSNLMTLQPGNLCLN